MLGFPPALRAARAQLIVDAIDAGLSAGLLEIWSGARPDSGNTNVAVIPAHAVSTAYLADDYVSPGNGHYYRANGAGTSAASAPTWPTDGSTVADNDIVWQHIGAIPVRLGTLTFSDPCGVVSASGVLTFDAITEDSSAAASGTATWAIATDSDGNEATTLSVGDLASSADIKMNTTGVIQLGPIRATGGSITEAGDYRT